MTPVEALAEVRRYATLGRIRVSGHARQRGRERGARFADIRESLMNATRCAANEETAGRWNATGPDLDGDPLTSVVVFEADLLVVTLFEKG